MSSKQIKIRNLSFGYSKDKIVFDKLSLNIQQNQFILLTGPSGSGKSTLLKILSGLYPKFSGFIFQGNLVNLPNNWGMVFQEPDTQFTMSTPRQELIFTLENLQIQSSQAFTIINSVIEETDIHTIIDQKFTTLSGGEKQRVAFAVMLAMNPDVIFLDEPFANCDFQNRCYLIKQLQKLKSLGKTIIISDHIISDYKYLYDEILEVKNKKIVSLSKKDSEQILNKAQVKQNQAFKLPKSSNKFVFNLTNFSLKRENTSLIEQTNLRIYSGTGTLLTGANGTGKTSFFKALTKTLNYDGKITYLDQNIQHIKNKNYLKDINQAFQNSNDQFLMITVQDEINLSKKNNNKNLNDLDILKMVKDLDLNNCLNQVVYSLSGGQKKKLQILLLIISNPKVLLLDEPFSGLDTKGIQTISHILKNHFLKYDNSLILISHQLDCINDLCDYHLKLSNKTLNYIK